MERNITKLFIAVFVILASLFSGKVQSQICGSNTPTFTADLSGNPDSVWTSPFVQRQDTCCGATSPDACVQFEVTLDPDAYAIELDIVDGAMPSGALYYQVGCGPQVEVGERLCLSGTGPHTVTFCKPGNNDNVYQISSIEPPSASGDIVINEACQGTLSATGFADTSITWQSVPNNSFHNSFLSCREDCDTTHVQAQPGYPNYVDYEVCGNPEGSCGNITECDTVRVTFVSDLEVDILPDSPAVCYGESTETLDAQITGGKPPYQYNWSTGETTSTINAGLGNYSVSVTDSTTCPAAEDSVFVDSFTVPIQANAGPDTLLCGNFNGVPLSGSVQAASGGRWEGGNGTFNPSDSVVDPVYHPTNAEIQGDSLDLQLITTGNRTCNPDTSQVTLHFEAKPSPVISGNDPVCEFSSGHTYSTTNNPGSGYNWSVTGGQITNNSGNSIQVDWEASGTGEVAVTETNAAGCDTTVTLSVQIDPRPEPAITGNDTVCEFTAGHNYSTPNNAGSSYTWSVTGGNITNNSGNEITVHWQEADSGSVEVTETNSLGCDTTVTMPVAIEQHPTTMITGNDTVCQYTSGHTYSTPNHPGSSYTWTVSGGEITNNSGNSIQVHWKATGTGQVEVTETNALGCDTTVVKNVYKDSYPIPNINGADTVCQFTQGHTYSTSNNPGSTYNWNVTGGDITSGNGTPAITIDWTNPDSGRIEVTETTPRGCDTTVEKTVYFYPSPDATFSAVDSICTGESGLFTALDTNYNYDWQIDRGTIQNGQSTSEVSARWNDSGDDSIALQVTNQYGCQANEKKLITVNPTPTPSIEGPESVCSYSIHQYTVQKSNAENFTWQAQGGTILSGNDTKNVNVEWGNSGDRVINVTAENEYGCDTTVEMEVEVHEAPQPDISGPGSVCAHSENVIYETPYQSGNRYEWQVTGGELVSKRDTNIAVVDWGDSGEGVLTVQELNPETGCTAQATFELDIEPTPTPSIDGPVTICVNDEIRTYRVTPNNDHNYFWSVTGGDIIEGSGTHRIRVNWDNVDSGKVEIYVVNEATRCDSSTSLKIEVFEAVAISPQDTAGCQDFELKFEGASNDEQSRFLWNFDNGVQTTQKSPEVTFETPGLYHVSLQTENEQGCKDTSYTTVRVYESPTAQFKVHYSDGRSFIMAEEDSLRLENLASDDSDYFEWDFGDGNESLKKEPVHHYDSAGEYTVEMVVENRHGCKDSTSDPVTVKVPSKISVPNAFTPDGNDINDHFHIGTYNITDFEIIIFNRWGEIIFRSQDKDFAWDGHYKGEKAQDEVYHYLILAQDQNGEKMKRTGKIVLLK